CKNQYTQGAHVASIWYRLSGTTYRQKESLGTTSHAKKAVLQKNAKSRLPRREAAKPPKKALQTLKKFYYRTIQNFL
ncbi:MAG: hypothetical protein SPK96_04905, partial [Bacteroidaceae bacterium]|nr:hypothetical protein [Bacteroidaceae bacterium]